MHSPNNFTKKKHPSFDEWLFLVSQMDQSWNSLYPDILKIYKSLKGLGFDYEDNEVVKTKDKNDDK